MSIVVERSLERITVRDLRRLGEIAREDRDEMFARSPHWARYRKRLLCVALCQGAAQHYTDKRNGVKDFDVWTFFSAPPAHYPDPCYPDPCLYRRNKPKDFGASKFGRHPDLPLYVGRKVDLLSRSLQIKKGADTVEALRHWLRTARRGSSPYRLAKKAVVLIEPCPGLVVWPVS